MILCIDCFKLVKGTGKSLGIYNLTVNLIRNLVKYKEIQYNEMIRNCNVIVFGNKNNKRDFDLPEVQFIEVNLNPLNKFMCLIWELIVVSIYCKKYSVDNILFPRGFRPLFISAKNIIIVHDLIPFYYQKNYYGYFNKFENFYIMERLRSSIKKADKVISVSETSKMAALKLINVDKDKITVIHNGLNLITGKQDFGDYIIAVTSSLPHKNSKGIIRSYIEYCNLTESPAPIIIVGIANIDTLDIPDKIKANISCIKYIEKDSDLHNLISNAKVFLFLSLIEGFGFPPLEAMQLGVPVICSNTSSLPEVVGDAGLLVTPNDYENVGKQIIYMLENEDVRKSYIQKGYLNTKRFTWESRTKLYWDVLV